MRARWWAVLAMALPLSSPLAAPVLPRVPDAAHDKLIQEYHGCLERQASSGVNRTAWRGNCRSELDRIRGALGARTDRFAADAEVAVERRRGTPSAPARVHPSRAKVGHGRPASELALVLSVKPSPMRDYIECVNTRPNFGRDLDGARATCATQRDALRARLTPDDAGRVLAAADAVLLAQWRRASEGGAR